MSRPAIARVAIIAAALLAAGPLARGDDEQARVRDLLRYGIDSQLLEIVGRLKSARDGTYVDELRDTLATSRSTDVRRAILELFTELAVRDGEPSARAILAAGEEKESAAVMAAAAAYLSAINATGLVPLLLPLVEARDAPLASVALRAIGRTRDPSALEPLLAKLKALEFPDNRRGELIVALGDLGDVRAYDALLAIVQNADEERTRRMYAAEALGRLGDRRATAALQQLFREGDALLRVYAAGALAALDVSEALPDLVAGLRDENVKVRLQCAKALARPLAAEEAAAVVPMLRWKVSGDPERAVRLECIRALGAIGSPEALEALQRLLADANAALDHREAALAALAAGHAAASLASIEAVVVAAQASKDPKPLAMMARVLASAGGPSLEPVYGRLLDSGDFTVRIAAIRGVAAHGIRSLVGRLEAMANEDPVAAVQAEARRALERLVPR